MKKQLTEDINRIKELMLLEGEVQLPSSDKKIIDEFIAFVKKELNIKNDIDVVLQNDKEGIKTTAIYNYADGDDNHDMSTIRVYAKDRALVDILRSIAHEFVHHWQNESGKLKGKPSNVGGSIEDEANAKSGELVKMFGTNNQEIYNDGEQSEMAEQDDFGGDTGGGTPMDKWETGLARGKANPIDQNSKWESGITRGKGNPLF